MSQDPSAKDLRNVIAFVLADGQLDGADRAFIDDLRVRAGMDAAQAADLVAQIQSGEATLKLSREPAEARRII